MACDNTACKMRHGRPHVVFDWVSLSVSCGVTFVSIHYFRFVWGWCVEEWLRSEPDAPEF